MKVRTIRKAKALAFREGVYKASLKPTGVWRLARWGREKSGKPKELPQFPAIKDRTGGKAIDFDGKVRALRKTLFPPPPQADLGDIATARYPAPIELPHVVTTREVSKAIWNPAADKAPGRTGIPNRFLRLLTGEPIMGAVVHLFQACIEAGHHPT